MRISEEKYAEILAKVGAYDESAAWNLEDRISKIDDSILDRVLRKLGPMTSERGGGSDMRVIPVPEKMNVNHFSGRIERIIRRSLCHSKRISEFIKKCNRTDNEIPDLLRSYYNDLYMTFRNRGCLHDRLFLAMQEYLADVLADEIDAAAATAIMVHLFLTCDVFEKSHEEAEARLWEEDRQ